MLIETYIDPITKAPVTLETDTFKQYVEREEAVMIDLIVDESHHADPVGLKELFDSFEAHARKIGLPE